MWQRIQSVFIVLTIVSLLIALIQPVWQNNDRTAILTPFYLFENGNYTYLPYSLTAVLAVAGITLAIMEISRYKNRMMQIKLGALNSVMLAGMMICAVWFASKLSDKYPTGFSYGLGLYLSFASVIFNWLAVRFIRRDEKLVRDSDRLR